MRRREGPAPHQRAKSRERDSELPCAGTPAAPPRTPTETPRCPPQSCKARHVTLARTPRVAHRALWWPHADLLSAQTHSEGPSGWRSDRLGTARCSAEATGDCFGRPGGWTGTAGTRQIDRLARTRSPLDRQGQCLFATRRPNASTSPLWLAVPDTSDRLCSTKPGQCPIRSSAEASSATRGR